ncbi:tail protein X [Roseovarius ramblicola]|uniref:Tail protein X n=1 Tax=Roseovarius ramblicola TaxID=2022336 RepID=A0ABV5HYL5_9RHOB
MLYYRSRDGDVVDRVVWQHYGRQNDGLVEAVLEANPGLADLGPVLPAGIRIALPDIPEPEGAASVRLWG